MEKSLQLIIDLAKSMIWFSLSHHSEFHPKGCCLPGNSDGNGADPAEARLPSQKTLRVLGNFHFQGDSLEISPLNLTGLEGEVAQNHLSLVCLRIHQPNRDFWLLVSFQPPPKLSSVDPDHNSPSCAEGFFTEAT